MLRPDELAPSSDPDTAAVGDPAHVEAALTALADAWFVIDADGLHSRCSHARLPLLPLADAQLCGQPLGHGLLQAQAERWRAAWRQAVASGAPQRFECELALASGAAQVVEVAVAPLGAEEALFLLRDITVARARQDALRDQQAAAIANRAKSEFLSRVSHEMRTPLNAVIGFSDVMKSELLGPVGHPRYREYVQHICDSGRELLKSAEDTLAITYLLDHDPNVRLETGIDLAPIVKDAWEFHVGPPGGATGLSLEANLPDTLEVLIDRRPMRQILINLFAEAVRRSDARGTVGFGAKVDGDLVQIEVYLRGRPDSSMAGQASLPICLARALLELHGASLIEVEDPYSTWRAVTVLPCAAQSDFFSLPDRVAVTETQAHLC